MKYSVGALLYTPALNTKIAQFVLRGEYGGKYTLALCLEDTIAPDMVGKAEAQIRATLESLAGAAEDSAVLPKIFIRVREPGQAARVFETLGQCGELVSGFIFPKYSLSNAADYNRELLDICADAGRKLYMMPILESADLIDCCSRRRLLESVRAMLHPIHDYVLNIRVGGNDFSNAFATRRHVDETIYDIVPLGQLLGDILAVFSRDYVVSGPVWEYFSGEDGLWEKGLRREMKLDKLNGFVGKTVIHPRQIPIVNDMLRVSREDYEDAQAIVNWGNGGLLVGKSGSGDRMNEVPTHINWARKTLLLAKVYGVRSYA